MNKRILLPTIFVLVTILCGCESSGDADSKLWQSEASSGKTSEIAADNQTEAVSGVGVDEVSFGALKWTFGGVNGSRAKHDAPTIGNLSIRGNNLSYKWTGPTLAAWGLSDGNHNAICAVFFQNSNGSWVGGKFDWISTSRTTRSLGHCTSGYGGWSTAGLPNPCPAAFVIINASGTKRSNVIAGTWYR